MTSGKAVGLTAMPDVRHVEVLDEVSISTSHTPDRPLDGRARVDITVEGATAWDDVIIEGTVQGKTGFQETVSFTANGTITSVFYFDEIDDIQPGGSFTGGTIKVGVSAFAKYIDFTDESLSEDQEVLEADTGVDEDISKIAPGKIEANGGWSQLAEPENLMEVYRGFFGEPSSTPIGGVSVLALASILATMSFDSQISGMKKLKIAVAGATGWGDVDIDGLIGATSVQDTVTFTANGTLYTDVLFDSVTVASGITTTGFTGGTIAIEQVDAYTHEYTYKDTIPSWLLGKLMGGIDVLLFYGYRFDTLGIEGTNSDWVMVKPDGIARYADLMDEVKTPSVSEIYGFTFTDGIFKIGSVETCKIESAGLTLNRNLDKGEYSNCGRGRRDAKTARRSVEASLTMVFEDTEMFERWMGGPGKLTPQNTFDEFAFDLEYQHPEEIYPGQNYEMNITVPRCVITKTELPQRGAEVDRQTVSIKAYKDNVLGYNIKVTLVNGIDAI